MAQVPLHSLDLQLEQRFGAGSRVDYFVARHAQLYFVCRTPGGFFAVVVTDAAGGNQNTVSLGTTHIPGFDVDGQGRAYVLAGSRVTVYDSRWDVADSFAVDPPAISGLSAVGGRLMGMHENGRLNFLKGEQPAFTMEAYPGPWVLFSVGEDKVGIFRPQAAWWHVFQIDGDWSEHGPFGGKLADFHPVDATGADDKLYLLGAESKAGTVSVVEGERHVGPKNSFELEIAGGFHPKMIRLSGGLIYLADSKGAVASYDLAAALKSGRLTDHGPALVGDLDAVRVAVAKSGYRGRATIRLNLGADGSVGELRIEPAWLMQNAEVTSAVAGLRFQPKFENGMAVAAPVSLEIGVP